MTNLAAAVAAFEGAARSLEACRLLLLDLVRADEPTDPTSDCAHVDAVPVTSFGAASVRVCPDCGEEVDA
jgi:hypothetical protein